MTHKTPFLVKDHQIHTENKPTTSSTATKWTYSTKQQSTHDQLTLLSCNEEKLNALFDPVVRSHVVPVLRTDDIQ